MQTDSVARTPPAETQQPVDEARFDKFNTDRQGVDRFPPPDHPPPRSACYQQRRTSGARSLL
jgi:hypothetical protein